MQLVLPSQSACLQSSNWCITRVLSANEASRITGSSSTAGTAGRGAAGTVHGLSVACNIKDSMSGVAILLAARQISRRIPKRRFIAHRAEAAEAVATAEAQDMVSPFEGGGEPTGEKAKLPLTLENVESVLDELRPYLQSDGGDCKIVEIDGPVVRLEMQGACGSCSSSAVTLKMGIERTLMERIPEIAEVVSVMPDQEPLTEEGVEEVLNGIRPFLSVSGGTIDLQEIEDGEAAQITLQMTGPPLKSMAVRVEVVNRIKRKYPLVQDVNIVGADGESAPGSA